MNSQTMQLAGNIYSFAQRNSVSLDTGALPIAAASVLTLQLNFGPFPLILPVSALRIAALSILVVESGAVSGALELLDSGAQLNAGTPAVMSAFAQVGARPRSLPFSFARDHFADLLFTSNDLAQIVGRNLTQWGITAQALVRNPSIGALNVELLVQLTYETWVTLAAHLGYP